MHTEIPTPFGKLVLYFFDKNHVCIATDILSPLTIRGIQYSYRGEFVILDGAFRPGRIDNGRAFSSYNATVRFKDWQRNGSPSASACEKIREQVDIILDRLNSGCFKDELEKGRLEAIQSQINRFLAEISECRKKILDAEEQIRQLEARK